MFHGGAVNFNGGPVVRWGGGEGLGCLSGGG